jgi:hypothetical protein
LSSDLQETPFRPALAGRDGLLNKDAITKSDNKVSNMASVMIIFLIVHLFRKDQAYTSLFSSALTEGIRDTFGQVAQRSSNDSAKENINAHDK